MLPLAQWDYTEIPPLEPVKDVKILVDLVPTLMNVLLVILLFSSTKTNVLNHVQVECMETLPIKLAECVMKLV